MIRGKRFNIMAIHVNARQMGVAVFDGPKRLICYGTHMVPITEPGAEASIEIRQRLVPSLTTSAPSCVVVHVNAEPRTGESSGVRTVLRILEDETTTRSIKLICIEEAEIGQAFEPFDAATKQEIAAWVALFFPALRDQFSRLQRLPNNRALFDAVAVGVAYLSRFGAYQMRLSNVSADTPT
jgi:hypothetical protein